MTLTQREVKAVYKWTVKVRPVWGWWTPTANTVAYYPLTSDILDHSANGYNLSHASSGSVTYSNNMAISTDVLQYTSRQLLPTSWNFTIWFWCYPSSWNNIGDRDSWWPTWYMCNQSWDYKWNFILSNSWRRLGNTSSISWPMHMMVTRSGDTFTLYINWQSNSTWSWGGSLRSAGNGFYIAGFSSWIGAIIIESVAWTATEVSNYYDLTKWDYWVS